ncbi:hypothetical protein RND81_05G157000 [Saponaria officinalis]|uniref:Reverse transcriptase domain-containing protein n=1 Tax=Saponaria officinalis TaxID=3572 RepID=A0AAW1L1B1_SAPOF
MGKKIEGDMNEMVNEAPPPVRNKDEVVIDIEDDSDVTKEPLPPSPRVYVPPVPFPQRLAKAKLEQKYGKFIEILKNLHINIPFLDAISDIPSYEKFLKDLLSRKKKMGKSATFNLSKECSVILLNKLPPKLDDPESFSIPCSIGNVAITSALCDLGASVGEAFYLRKLLIPCDFFVMDIPEDTHVPIILGRPCLATAGAMIDVKNGKLTLQVGDEKVEFELNKSMGGPSMGDTCCSVDVMKDYLIEPSFEASFSDSPRDSVLDDSSDDVQMLAYAWMLDSPSSYEELTQLEQTIADVENKESSMPSERT